jgi:hypothetical protein
MIPTNEVELIQDFRAFVATKDPEDQYNFQHRTNCSFAQYLTSKGVVEPRVSIDDWYSYPTKDRGRIPGVLVPLLGDDDPDGNWVQLHTWGALLARLDGINIAA